MKYKEMMKNYYGEVYNISELLNKLFTLCDDEMLKTVGKLYVSISGLLPQFNDNTSNYYLINETNLVKLT